MVGFELLLIRALGGVTDVAANRIDGPVASDAQHPAGHAPTLGVVATGPAPDRHERVLDSFFGTPGSFYRRTALGREFFDYAGERFLRGDLCNASVELGSLLQHEGPILEAEQRAAEVFGAERTYFVLNGTSTSNKMVALGLLSPGDLVLFDRNCHKSMHHGALMLAGATPVYLNPTRGASGIIGPVDHDALDERQIREQLRAHPLIGEDEAWRKERPFRLAVLTNTTYDGICYNAQKLIEKLGHLCDYVVFDEAWMAYARFHPLYRRRFGMDLTDLRPDDPGIYTTQSTHKCLAGLSQASQIHVRDSHLSGQSRRLGHERFNEVFMMHTSTSPQYNIIASLDVGAQMMRGREGVALIDGAIRESIALRKQILSYQRDLAARNPSAASSWFFGVFGPTHVDVSAPELEAAISEPRIPAAARRTLEAAAAEGGLSEVPMPEVPEDILASVPACWAFKASDEWHDLRGLAPDYVMLDPTKCTITMPGVGTDGAFDQRGIPAAIPAAVLRARGIVSEKTSFYTMLVLITAAIERGKSGTLLAELLRIKHEYDGGASLATVLPGLTEEHPERYGGLLFSDLCTEMHEFLRTSRADVLQQRAFSDEHQPEIAVGPSAAHAELIAGRVELVPLTDLANRIAATLIVPYPPGIAIMVPGERFTAGSAVLDYLQLFEDNDNRFPGFTSEIQGVFPRRDAEGKLRYHTYVLSETG